MPSPLRRSGSGLLQNPRPGLLPSPHPSRLGPLGPSRAFVSTRQSSRSLRPAALLLLASPPGSPRTPEVGYRAPLAACPGGDSHPLVDGPGWATQGRQKSIQFGEARSKVVGCHPGGCSSGFGLPFIRSLLPFGRGGISRSRTWSSGVAADLRRPAPRLRSGRTTFTRRTQRPTGITHAGDSLART